MLTSQLVPHTKKLEMQSERHRNIVYQRVELLLLVPMFLLLAIPTCLLIVKEKFYYNYFVYFSVMVILLYSYIQCFRCLRYYNVITTIM